MRKTLLVLAVVLCLFSLSAGNAQAAKVWYACTIAQAGAAGTSGANFLVTDTRGAFTNMWMIARVGQEKAMLAVGLTGIASGLNVRVYVDIEGAPAVTPVIQNMYLMAP